MPNVNQLTLANEVFHHLMRFGAQHELATQLVASAAFQVGFVRIAAGLARWSQEPDGHNEMQARLSDEQFDVLMLAPVDAAARSAVSCMDLCAAAAYRLTGAVPQPTGQESDVQRLRKSIKNKEITLGSSEAAWLRGLVGSAEWRLLMKVRTAVTHHSINSLSILGTGNPATSLIMDGKPYGNVDLCQRFAQLAERQFDNFTRAIISDFSLFYKLASRSLYTSVYGLHPATRLSADEHAKASVSEHGDRHSPWLTGPQTAQQQYARSLEVDAQPSAARIHFPRGRSGAAVFLLCRYAA